MGKTFRMVEKSSKVSEITVDTSIIREMKYATQMRKMKYG